MKPLPVSALTPSKLFLLLKNTFLKWENIILQDYPKEPSYERRVGKYLFHLTFFISIVTILNRLIHPFEGNIGIDLFWESVVSIIWLGNIYLIRKKKISLVIFLYFLCNTIIFFIHFIIKDYYAVDLTYVHPYHVFEVGGIILICCIFVSFKFIHAKWMISMAIYGSIILGLHGFAVSQHYPTPIVVNLTLIAIFGLFLGLVSLHFTAGFLHRQREIIEVQQQEIKQKNKELANRITDLKNFTYIASHDLKAPLRTVISFQDLLKRRLGTLGDEHALSYLDFAHKGAKTLEEILTDLLAFTRLTHHKAEDCFERVDLSGIIGDIKKEHAAQFPAPHEIHIPKPLPEVYSVKSYMKIVLQNLIINGIKFNKHQTPQVTILGKQEGSQVMISVVDNGIGINEKYLERIFAPFERLHAEDEYEGRGFGLAITKHLIEKLDGEIHVVSELGVGSVFTTVLKNQA
ncbi:MAG: ATP-binding protein [Bacteroidota bacterium]